MNKETFLEELRGYLRILEDQEQEDILAEYAQHIDMKLQKGLSEEEAIRDFGPMRELAAEILEAYHVKPEFDKKPSAGKVDWKGTGMADTGKWFRKAKSILKSKTMAVIEGIKRGYHWIGKKCLSLAAFLWKPFSRPRTKAKNTIEGDLHNVETVKIEQRTKKSFFTALLKGIATVWNWLWAFCIWWIRLFWNLLWLFMTLFFGGMALITLAGVGTILVLLPQGYPMVGMLLICLGAMLCLGTLSCGSYSLILHRKKEISEGETEGAFGDVAEHELDNGTETEENYEKDV